MDLTSVSISGSGIPRIGSDNQAVITILANDAPHGEVSFNVTQYTVAEGNSTVTARLSLYRRCVICKMCLNGHLSAVCSPFYPFSCRLCLKSLLIFIICVCRAHCFLW